MREGSEGSERGSKWERVGERQWESGREREREGERNRGGGGGGGEKEERVGE